MSDLKRLATGFIKIFVCVIVSLSLAAGGIMLHPLPVQAALGIDPAGPITDNVTECMPYSLTFSRDGTSCPGASIVFFWVAGPPLPAWLTLDTNTGVLSGCPPWGSSAGSPYGPFSVGVTELRIFPWCWAIAPPCSVTLNVNATDNITIVPTYVAMWAMESMPLALPLSATGCSGNYTWSAAGLPLGLAVDPVSGVISGIPALGTAGLYTVTVTATDTNTCCCPPGIRDFLLIIDSYAAYIAGIIYSSSYDFTVQIGPGLTEGLTSVAIDGSPFTTLGGNQSEVFSAHPGEIHFVTVDKTIPGSNPQTRFRVKGADQTMVSESNITAFFDYAREVYIETGSEPPGIAQPPGAGFYAIGGNFSSTAPSPVASDSQQGVKYIFKSWSLLDGGSSPSREASFTVSGPGMIKAVYDTYYLLQLKSEYPPINEASWELKDSTASYDLALQDIPMAGFWGFFGGTMRPENGKGTHVMTAPYTQVITWYYDFTVPIVIFIVIALLIIGLVAFLVIWNKRSKKTGAATTTTAPQPLPPPPPPVPPITTPTASAAASTATAVAAAPEKKALPEGESKDRPNFCPKCGAPVDADAEFCKKCGRKLI